MLSALAGMLEGCGGGGGDPGMCYGGPQVCAQSTSSAANQTGNPASGTAVCADFTWQQDAQAAFLAGETQLDGNDNDGKACEHLPSK